ncbi:GTP 3',8-cyclase [Fusobacterium sp. DD29]|uniref:radical SAM protein n=1 Tax=unclassified Fusobacterium TaxID=2648384 RepID=UPI001B8CFA7A|nr:MULTISPECIES: radical SAM protein [unclassified Fusobacterium]MBR8700641.1 GTP 3',8-cyclase [Fusobacterium sp. DD45]MBR8710403.1 GTP 3',8-cyclase [Fusobacterium sp. DD28]MBR8749998.1 GTP 3',8-cyclase [Fusobacterium sp. DD29]MBR8750963.1 GTP 3',8-cyclase [Fusobacterium sp. DD26]MBR8762237.1 GTP 3',8-cyclase [Fusobacterium sp. DD25]
MKKLNCIFGPIPSRRLGRSLGISPIPKKTCNYSCVYCQLGRTDKMTNTRKEYFPLEVIIKEFKDYLKEIDDFDVVSIVGEGEPTLYSRLGELIDQIKTIIDKPVAVITNSALLYEKDVQEALMKADIVLPSLDAYNEEVYKKVDRPFGKLDFNRELNGLIEFSKLYKGELWLEVMLVKNMNSSRNDIDEFKKIIDKINHDRVYINTPVRPPAESFVQVADSDEINYAVEKLNGISIDKLTSGSFFSEIPDNYEAILNIIRRHPMTQFEVQSLLASRKETDMDNIFARLHNDESVDDINYKGITTYRLK